MAEIVIRRQDIENRAVTMLKALAVEEPTVARLLADDARTLDVMHGIRMGAAAAIDYLRQEHGGTEEPS